MPPRERDFLDLARRALDRREILLQDPATTCARLCHGRADQLPGVFVDRYAQGLTLILHLGTPGLPSDPRPQPLAEAFLRAAEPLGAAAIYYKPFVRDRSALGGRLDRVLSDPQPLVGQSLPEAITVLEHAVPFEVRLYDGFSTGLFLDQRENRRAVADLARPDRGARVLNLFCYTAGFSVASARAGAITTSVDVSARTLDWARRNFALSALDPGRHFFARMGSMEFLALAARKGHRFDLVILDPPTFGAADKRRAVAPWSAERDYPALVRAAAAVLDPEGLRLLFCSTNTRSLCEPGALRRLLRGTLGPAAEFEPLPEAPADFPPGEPSASWALARVATRSELPTI
ncbi:MAG TPA: hypothetical protein DEB06_06860 [Phycisphaerales bacterium]|nr:hypothetical protein [Phycisphaerales bacterium]